MQFGFTFKEFQQLLDNYETEPVHVCEYCDEVKTPSVVHECEFDEPTE